MVSGFPWVEWLERTTSSDSTGSMWAAEYLTTPSSPRSAAPLPSTAMMELTFTEGTTGIACRPNDEGVPRRHVVDRRGDEPDSRDARVPVDLGRHPSRGGRQAQHLPRQVREDAPTYHEAPAMRGAASYASPSRYSSFPTTARERSA
jgi:hypothetical protein